MRSKWLIGWLALACVSACEGGVTDSVVAGDPAVQQQPFVVHEWGTFTSVHGSAGALLSGLHHEDEVLPSFVYGRGTLAGSCADCPKDLEAQPSGVTQKLETPVLYFYGDVPEVRVTVGFPQGVISQWFPQASGFSPPLGDANLAQGSMSWEAQLVPGLTGFPEVPPEDVWAPSRQVASVPVKVGDEHEQFIFYRGLGTFSTPFSVRSHADGTLSIHNDSPDEIAQAFLLRVHEPGGIVVPLGSLAGYGERSGIVIPEGGKEHDIEVFVEHAADTLATALQDSGLYADEARAMVNTWSHSYFRTPGLRVLYIVPRTWTDALLPIDVEPQANEMVRILVGRAEVLTQTQEQQVMAAVQAYAAAPSDAEAFITALGRFAEPKLRRAEQLLTEPADKAACQQLIELAATMP